MDEGRTPEVPTTVAEEIAERRRHAVAQWESALAARQQAAQAGADSREQRLEARRKLDGLRRTHEAVTRRADLAITETMSLLADDKPRAVVAHRQQWMRSKIVDGLAQRDLRVLAELEDGAETLGIVVVEQPELLVLEDRLPSVTVREVLHGVREFAPRTLTAVQVDNEAEVGSLLDAGATAVFHRRVPPAELCAELAQLLSGGGGGRAAARLLS